MKIPSAELVELLTNAAKKIVGEESAAYFATENVETEIRKSHRTDPMKSAIKDLEASLERKETPISYEVNLPGYLAIDFKGHGPLTHMKQVHDELEVRSGKNGIAMVAFKNSQGMHTLHAWVQGLAKRGLVALAAANGGPGAVVPFNGTRGLFGTNPIAFGFPGKDHQIHCVDMATSEIPFFEIMEANKEGKALRERSAVDKNGEYTNDPKEALDFSASETDPVSNIVPMGGGYKGYYLVFLFELLTSGLISMPSSPEMSADFIPEEHGGIIIVFNPRAMGSENSLQTSTSTVVDALMAQTPKKGSQIPIPGGNDNERMSKASEEIEIDDSLLEKLRSLVA